MYTCVVQASYDASLSFYYWSGFHLATKIWGGSVINEWAYLVCQVTWNVSLGDVVQFLQIVLGNQISGLIW